MSLRLSPITNAGGRAQSTKLPISPLVGEMSGRTEGGAKDREVLILPPPTASGEEPYPAAFSGSSINGYQNSRCRRSTACVTGLAT